MLCFSNNINMNGICRHTVYHLSHFNIYAVDIYGQNDLNWEKLEQHEYRLSCEQATYFLVALKLSFCDGLAPRLTDLVGNISKSMRLLHSSQYYWPYEFILVSMSLLSPLKRTFSAYPKRLRILLLFCTQHLASVVYWYAEFLFCPFVFLCSINIEVNYSNRATFASHWIRTECCAASRKYQNN